MQVCRELSDISLKIDLVDEYGVQLSPISVNFSVRDSNGIEVLPTAATFDFNAEHAIIEIPGTVNELGLEPDGVTPKTKDFYTAIVSVLLQSGATYTIYQNYIVRKSLTSTLVVMENSYQLLVDAEMLSLDIRLSNWRVSVDTEKRLALIEAYKKFGKLRYEIETTSCSMRVDYLNDLSAVEFLALPEKFRKSLRMAQLIEADEILKEVISPSMGKLKIENGIISETVGDTSATFAKERPSSSSLGLNIGSRAMREISEFVVTSCRTGRA